MTYTEIAPVAQRSTPELIAEQLRVAISRHVLAPGEQLGEVELAAHFGVSRGPLREAMQRLVSEGLLHNVRNRGIFVAQLTLDDVVDVYRTRSLIERGALEAVLVDRRESAFAALGPVIATMRTAAERRDSTAVADADQQFHATLVAASGSPRLVRAARTLLIETRMCLGDLPTTYSDLREQVAEHRALHLAIRDAEPADALALLADHLDDAVRRLRRAR